MRLVTFSVATPIGRVTRLGAHLQENAPDRIVDLTTGYADYLSYQHDDPRALEMAQVRVPPDMLAWLQGGSASKEAAQTALQHVRQTKRNEAFNEARLVFERSQVRLLSPLPRPSSFRDFSIYYDHMSKNEIGIPRTRSENWYRWPSYYKGSPASIAGPEDPIPFPYYSEKLDPEFEIGIILGRKGRNLSIEDAANCIAGYTILVDSSARELWSREVLGPAKSKDFHTALGPCLVTADSIDPSNIPVRLLVDGELWWEGNAGARRGWTPAHLVAYASDNETVHPGDLIGCGAIGDSCSLDTHRWPKVGQVMTFEAEGIGRMSLRIARGEKEVRHVGEGMRNLMTPPENAA